MSAFRGPEPVTPETRLVTSMDPLRGAKRAVWFVDSAAEREDLYGGPSRYGPTREYLVASCATEAIAARVAELWNAAVDVSSEHDDNPPPGGPRA